ncbi:MAG: DeoR/GlpR transcriptional regulator [Anaerolineae bacterium]|nr:DeoR/GlpR transcriptional regulator [Anaerolineae bacterium]
MASRLIPAERHELILNILERSGIVRVSELSEALNVSDITIRRDLEQLEQDGLLERTHGGAMFSRRLRTESLFTVKYKSCLEEKVRIGRVAADLVEPGETVFINSGSTTLQIFRHLLWRDVRVVTCNAGAIAECHGGKSELVVVGGAYRETSHSFVGPLAVSSLQWLYASKCFIGIDGISVKYGLTTPSLEEAEVARTMIQRTHGKVIVVADHTKMGVVADSVTVPIKDVDALVVDNGIDKHYRHDLESLGIEVHIA